MNSFHGVVRSHFDRKGQQVTEPEVSDPSRQREEMFPCGLGALHVRKPVTSISLRGDTYLKVFYLFS